MKEFFKNDEGQAVVEYVLAIAMAISIAAVIGISFRKTVLKLWQMIARDVTAACPGCEPETNIKFR